MKLTKKITTLVLAICLAVSCFSMVSFAANSIQFEDPSTAVGETLDLLGVIKTNANVYIEDRTIDMTYDTAMLKFEQGDNVTETEAGKLTYTLKGQKSTTNRVEFRMKFTVLKEGTTKVQIEKAEIFSTTNAKLTFNEGSSTITIAAGDPSKLPPTTPVEPTGTTVEIDGETYEISETFKKEDVPEGFEEATLEYADAEYKAVSQAETGLYLLYMLNEEGAGEFFLYVDENATFAPFKQISVSDATTIVLLSYVENLAVPAPFVETTVEVNGYSFPAWQDPEHTDVCLIYAMNNRGEKSFYQFDTVERTYQRYELPEVEEVNADSLAAKLNEVLGKHMDIFVLGVGVGFVIFLIIILVLSVKLYNRNAELDELYDEYGIDLFDDELVEQDDNVVRLVGNTEEEDIDYETEDDIVIAGLDEIEEDSEDETVALVEEKSEMIGELEETDDEEEPETIEEAMKTLAAAVQSDEDYWNDDEDSDFEMDFIDLDD